MKYYSTLRPVAPGTYPKYPANKPLQIVNYDDRTYVEEIDRNAWGWIEYPELLPAHDLDEYDLVPEDRLAAEWIETQEAYRICDPAHPEQTLAYDEGLTQAQEYAERNGYAGIEVITPEPKTRTVEMNRIEENLTFHWTTLILSSGGLGNLDDDEMERIKTEVNLFIDAILPQSPTEGWAFWTDGTEILTKSEVHASLIAHVIDSFAEGRYHYYDPVEDARDNSIDDHTGYWCVDWD